MSEEDQQTSTIHEMKSMRQETKNEMQSEAQLILNQEDEDETKTNKSSEHKVIPPKTRKDYDDDDFDATSFALGEIKYVGKKRAVAASEQAERYFI